MEATAVVESKWPRGAEWRKWDLHVHSPASHGYSGDYNQFIIQLGNADCDVIGINDYFSVEGYREVCRRLAQPGGDLEGNKAYRDSLEKLRSKVLLPVVECRMNNILLDKKGASGPRINFHLIFDPDLASDNIETFLKAQQVGGSSIGNRYANNGFLLNDVRLTSSRCLRPYSTMGASVTTSSCGCPTTNMAVLIASTPRQINCSSKIWSLPLTSLARLTASRPISSYGRMPRIRKLSIAVGSAEGSPV